MVIESSFLEPEGERNDKGCISWRKSCGGVELTDECLYNIDISGSVMKHQKANVEDLSQCRFRSEISWYVSLVHLLSLNRSIHTESEWCRRFLVF
jgi:hypothetical protein